MPTAARTDSPCRSRSTRPMPEDEHYGPRFVSLGAGVQSARRCSCSPHASVPVRPATDLRRKPACVDSEVFSTNVPRTGCVRPETYQQHYAFPSSNRVGCTRRRVSALYFNPVSCSPTAAIGRVRSRVRVRRRLSRISGVDRRRRPTADRPRRVEHHRRHRRLGRSDADLPATRVVAGSRAPADRSAALPAPGVRRGHCPASVVGHRRRPLSGAAAAGGPAAQGLQRTHLSAAGTRGPVLGPWMGVSRLMTSAVEAALVGRAR